MEQGMAQLPQGMQGMIIGRGDRLQRGLAAGVTMNGDAFMEVFQQMMDGMAGGETLTEGQIVQGIPGVAGQTDPFAEIFGEQADTGAADSDMLKNMQMLAGMFVAQPQDLAALLEAQTGATTDAAQTPAVVGQVVGTQMATAQQQMVTAQQQTVLTARQGAVTAQGQMMIAGPEAQAVLSQNAAVQTAIGQAPVQAKQEPTTAVKTRADGGQPIVDGQAVQTAFTTERPVTATGENTRALYNGESQFRSAVEVAKKQLDPKKSGAQELNLEVLGNATVPQPVVTGTALPKTAVTQEAKLADQLSEGIQEQLKLGKNEFVMKLKPESLGEITVKLTEKDGQTTLTILTASAQTAKLINNDLNALREAVKPMAVEVREAVQQTAENAQSQMQQFNMSGQQFAQQQQQQRTFAGQQHGRQTFRDDSAEVVLEPQVLETSGLDTYI